MGSNNSLTSLTSQYSQLQYYTTIDDKIYGQCQIYSSNKFPSCFIIKIITPLYHSTKLQLFSKLQNQQNIYLLSLYGYRLGKICHCKMQNIVTDSVISFWQYLSYSLRDVIQYRKKLGTKFLQIQIWHIIKACIHGYQAFKKMHIYYDFIPSKLMVNQQGRIRLSWMHIEQKNQHTNLINKIYKQPFTMGSEQYLSPQQLDAIQHKQFISKINLQKCNIFSLGMTLLQCLTLISPAHHFYQHFKINYFHIESIMHLPICSIYSQNLLILIGSMLRIQPNSRPTFDQVITWYSGFMKRDFSILIKSSSFTNQNPIGGLSIKPYSAQLRRNIRINF